ncbi:Elongation factor G [Gimesia panareensis]|uniref:Elongation factor G n=1 Tax=Gimesia panareensis TaxID=2527978 RepID=A0A518FXV0_9PLAN|nr:elongation factor G [Gimesia panareensis]QDV21193.1 Elongation factor G [Gimesia panareensis]
MSTSIDQIRNIGIIAHIDAGKTTTTERILYYAKFLHRPGGVDEGTTTTDFDEEEAKRGITIYSAAITCKWKGYTVNIIDTPGHVDFTAEVERSLRVLDGAVVVFSAMEGVEAQSETVWRQADKYNVPRICFINKMDRIGASFKRTFDEIKRRLRANPVALQIPIGEGTTSTGDSFTGVIDLIRMEALYYDQESMGDKFEVQEIPEAYLEQAQEWRSKLLESVAELDEEVLEQYYETEDIAEDVILRLLREATLKGVLQPTFCGSSLNYIGVQPVLDGVTNFLPSPLDRPPVEGINPQPKKRGGEAGEHETRGSSIDDPMCGLVFKIQADKHGDLCFMRVYSGQLKSGSRLLNPRTGKKELVSQLWRVQAGAREKVETDSIDAGDIIGVIGPKEAVTGDTLCDIRHPILLETISFPETVISMAVEPESSADRKKLEETLQKLSRQDPTFKAVSNEETGQTIVSGMGELHLEVLRNRMQKEFNLSVRVHKPRVSYRETVAAAVEKDVEFNRPSANGNMYFKVKLRLEPFKGDQPISIVSKLKPGELDPEMEKELMETLRLGVDGGGQVGFPLMNVQFVVLDAQAREGETNDVAVEAATSEALHGCIMGAKIQLLEPIMKMEVVTPDEFRGNIQADLSSRNANVLNSEWRGDLCVMEVEAPLSQLFGYSTQIRSLSQGRASFSMEPLKYAAAPPSVLKEMIG